ncbi:hypothetical protein DH2020_030781 [Rehmannia glutinosa]|uniref:Uncharacterized protein n=1 Tax=Rehmannia glutinosa TaxID=99300 RepID=A0ABR0VMY6_REHGL
MDRIHDELEEVKVEAEKLREECRAKTELYHSLRKAQAEQLAKSRQDKLEIDKLAQELNAKSEEICEIRQMYEELQSSLHKKDLFLQQINSANEKLRAEHGEKILKLESENKDLVLSLDEATARIQYLEEKTRASSEEIAGLKSLLSIKPEKSLEMHKNASKDLKQRDEYILKLEEENRMAQDRLKWKNEQFSHLEEAHGQLQTQFQASKMEWQKEKSSLIDEISSLQLTLDARVRVSESLETQLRLSNQALAHEESRRKVLEIELSEFRAKFENVVLDCQVAKSEIEQLTMKRDEEIAELRILLRKKEILANEMKYKTAQLEQENSDLLASLKDFQEAQINSNATSSSLKKLRNKLEGLEKLHNKCAINLKDKEAEWNSQIEKLRGDMKCCLSELECKNKSISELHNELEDCECLLEVKNEEIFVLIKVLKSEFYNAYSKLHEAKEKLNTGTMQMEKENMLLNQQLQSKNTKLHKVRVELKRRCDETAVSMERVESLDSLNQKNNVMEEELIKYKAMLDESNECQCRLKQQLLELEANRASVVEKFKLELQKSKSETEILRLNLEENLQALKQDNARLLATVKDKDAKIGKLQEQICVLDSVILAKSEAAEKLSQEKDDYIRLAEDGNCSIKSLQNEIARLKNELAEREAANIALLDAHSTLEQENKMFSSDNKEKDQKMQELQKEFDSLNQDYKSAVISFAEKEVMLEEALKTAEVKKIIEIEEKKQIIIYLETELNSLRNEVEFREKSLIQSKHEVLQLQASLQTKKSEMQELESEKQALVEDVRKASIDRENLIAQLEGICGEIGILCREDVELGGMLGKLSHVSEENSEPARNLLSSDGLNETTFSPSRKSIQVILDERTPLTELNC